MASRASLTPKLDLSRFDAAPLIAFTAAKETYYGTETDGRTYQMMSERAARTLILADSSKFEKSALIEYAAWGSNITLVSDVEPPEHLKAAIMASEAEIIAPNAAR